MDRFVSRHLRALEFAIPLLWLLSCAGDKGAQAPSGTLEATEIRLAPALAGRVLEMRAKEGDTIAAGDTLLVLDAQVLELSRAQTASGLATVEARRARAADGLEQAELALSLEERSLARLRQVEHQGSTTAQQLDEAATRTERARAARQAARHELQAIAAEREGLLATLAVQDRQLRDRVLLAPGPGILLERYAEPGEWLTPGQPAGLLADLSSLELRFFVEETAIASVQPGREIQVQVDAFPGEPRPAVITWISPRAEFTPKNVQTRDARSQLVYAVKARLENADGRLQIGMPAEVDMEEPRP